MGDRGEIRIADEQVHAGARFRSLAPWAWAQNVRQVAGQRGHCVVAAHNLAIPMAGGSPVELARFVFDSTPLETGLLCCAVFGVPRSVGWPSLDISWRVDSEDTDGNDDTTGDLWVYSYRPGFIDPISEARAAELGGLPRQVQWPLSTETTIEELVHGWFIHTPDASLATQGRVVKISAYAESSMGITPTADDLIMLRGLTVIGVEL